MEVLDVNSADFSIRFPIVIHRTLNSIVKAYPRKNFYFYNESGVYRVSKIGFICKLYKMGYWGFVKDRQIMHIWFSDDTSFEKLAMLLAHERAHMIEPWLEDEDEEAKALLFEDVTNFAVSIAKLLKKPKINRKA